MGFFLETLLGGLMAIPQDLYDAATVDGAGPLQRFVRIDLPMLIPQIKLLIVLGVIQGFQAFYAILVMTGGGPFRSTTVPDVPSGLSFTTATALSWFCTT